MKNMNNKHEKKEIHTAGAAAFAAAFLAGIGFGTAFGSPAFTSLLFFFHTYKNHMKSTGQNYSAKNLMKCTLFCSANPTVCSIQKFKFVNLPPFKLRILVTRSSQVFKSALWSNGYAQGF